MAWISLSTYIMISTNGLHLACLLADEYQVTVNRIGFSIVSTLVIYQVSFVEIQMHGIV